MEEEHHVILEAEAETGNVPTEFLVVAGVEEDQV
jgi:hypothetical protein